MEIIGDAGGATLRRFLLEQAVATDPVRYREFVVTPGAGNRNAHTPGPKRIGPDTLAQKPLDRPWRNTTS